MAIGSRGSSRSSSAGLPGRAHGLHRSDRRWRALFDEEQQAIRRRIGQVDVVIEHVGSSAVSGLIGRAEIDLLIGVRHNAQMLPCMRALQLLNYRVVSRSTSRSERWAHLMRGAGVVQFEVLMVSHLGPSWRRHIALRDHLRADAARAAAYGELKVQWAAKYGAGTASYQEAKRRYWATIATR